MHFSEAVCIFISSGIFIIRHSGRFASRVARVWNERMVALRLAIAIALRLLAAAQADIDFDDDWELPPVSVAVDAAAAQPTRGPSPSSTGELRFAAAAGGAAEGADTLEGGAQPLLWALCAIGILIVGLAGAARIRGAPPAASGLPHASRSGPRLVPQDEQADDACDEQGHDSSRPLHNTTRRPVPVPDEKADDACDERGNASSSPSTNAPRRPEPARQSPSTNVGAIPASPGGAGNTERGNRAASLQARGACASADGQDDDDDDVQITHVSHANEGRHPSPEQAASQQACCVCGGTRELDMLECFRCDLAAHSCCYYQRGSTAEGDAIAAGDQWECNDCAPQWRPRAEREMPASALHPVEWAQRAAATGVPGGYLPAAAPRHPVVAGGGGWGGSSVAQPRQPSDAPPPPGSCEKQRAGCTGLKAAGGARENSLPSDETASTSSLTSFPPSSASSSPPPAEDYGAPSPPGGAQGLGKRKRSTPKRYEHAAPATLTPGQLEP